MPSITSLSLKPIFKSIFGETMFDSLSKLCHVLVSGVIYALNWSTELMTWNVMIMEWDYSKFQNSTANKVHNTVYS